MLKRRMEASAGVLSRRERNGVVWYEFPALTATGDVVASVASRHGGVSDGSFASLNLSFAVGDEADRVRENRRRLAQAVGFREDGAVCAAQVHGRRVVYVDRQSAGAGYDRRETAIPDADGLITDQPGLTLWLGFADCAPVLAYDPRRGAVGIAHAGWRGTLAGIARELVASLETRLGCRASDLLVAIGPSIGPCCYAVGADVIRAFKTDWPSVDGLFVDGSGGTLHLNLWEANRRLLIDAGVPAENVLISRQCTACHVNEFFSHRAQRGRAGRFAAVIGLQEGG